jgi:hypothetical protein
MGPFSGRLAGRLAGLMPGHLPGKHAGQPSERPGGHLALANLRRHGRVLCQGVVCELGEVLEVSASGMRVFTSTKPPPLETVRDLVISSAPATFSLRALVSWSTWVGGNNHEVGLEFVELTETAQRGLLDIVHAVIARGDLRAG